MKIESIINDTKNTEGPIKRFDYTYAEVIAKQVWRGIAGKYIKSIEYTDQIRTVWSELIKYTFNNKGCAYDTLKSICIMGQTGSGKSETMKILNDFIKIDDVKFSRNNKTVPLKFRIYSSREIIEDYRTGGVNGISKYMIESNICIDDLGTEAKEALHYGNRLDVISEIIEIRYNKGLTTHFTTNLNEDMILERYDSRIHSRILGTCNMIKLNDKDFRLN